MAKLGLFKWLVLVSSLLKNLGEVELAASEEESRDDRLPVALRRRRQIKPPQHLDW